jgi:SNF2 family DNA or RNA helicase
MSVHGLWLADSFVMALWREDQAPAPPPPAPPPGRHAPLHPRAQPFAALKKLLPRQLDVYEDDVTCLLPTHANQVLGEGQPVPPEAQLRPWRLPTANAIADCFIELLLDEEAMLTSGVAWGTSIAYWQRISRFAVALVERNCYAPGIVRLESRYYPIWQAVFTVVEEGPWQQLEAQIPPLGLAVCPDSSHTATAVTARQLTLSFLDACVDHLVRHRLLRENTRRLAFKRGGAPVCRQWLNLLKAGRLGYLEGTSRDFEQFAEDVRAWNQYMRLPCLKTPFRMVYELSAPPEESGPWLVRYALQAARDPALLLRADQLWADEAGGRVNPKLVQARELLLAGLGRSLDLCPQVAASLQQPQPAWCELDRTAAIEFMTKTAVLLRRRGFHVILPTWWDDPEDAFQVTLRISPQAGGDQADRQAVLGVDQLVQYRWDVALGAHQLTEEEFRALSQTKEPLVHRYGKWYRLDAEALKRSLLLLDKRPGQGQATLDKALRLGLDLERSGVTPVIDFQVDPDPCDLLQRLRPGEAYRDLVPPPGFQGQLRPYQVVGYSWLTFVRRLGFGACLADDMGLGKTIQMIATILEYRQHATPPLPALIICPMSVVGNWVKEIARFAPELAVMVHHGSDRYTDQEFEAAANRHHVVITTYALAVRDQDCLLRSTWGYLILDEAQNIKNSVTKQALAIRSLRGHHRFCLTGTPIENRLTELWSIMEFLNPGYLGRLASFKSNFSIPIERDKNRSRADVLQKIIRPFVLRRLKSDQEIIRDLPDKQEMKVFCNLTGEQAALYQAVVDDMLANLDSQRGIARRGLVLSTLIKLKQVTNHPAHFLGEKAPLRSERSGKLQRLEEMLEVILEEGDRALVFTQFSEFGDLLWRKLQKRYGVEVLYLHGGTPKTRREEMVNRFQTRNGPPIFLLSLKAGGVGLNLTNACHVFHFDRWWNPAVEDQATDRAFRIGQTKNVQVHKFVCIGTVEEKIDQMLDEKKRLADFIVAPGDQMLTELSTEELRHIFSLTRDAVVE